MTVFQDEKHHFVFGKTLLNGKPTLVLKRTEKEEALIGSCFLPTDAPIRLKIEADGRYYSFYYALNSEDFWHAIAVGVDGSNLSTARSGGFIGAVTGLYATQKND